MKSNAGKLGKWLQDRVIDQLEKTLKQTIPRMIYKDFTTLDHSQLPNVFIVKNYPIKRYWERMGYCPLRSTGGRTEFVLFIKDGISYRQYRLECKNQDASGSTLDKLLMAIYDMKFCRPIEEISYPSFIIISGSEFDRRLLAMKSMVDDVVSKSLPSSIVKVVTVEEFIKEIKLLL